MGIGLRTKVEITTSPISLVGIFVDCNIISVFLVNPFIGVAFTISYVGNLVAAEAVGADELGERDDESTRGGHRGSRINTKGNLGDQGIGPSVVIWIPISVVTCCTPRIPDHVTVVSGTSRIGHGECGEQ